jgi:hypothetical protein
MAPKPKPGPTPQAWTRTGKCAALRCSCERFVPNGKQDGFAMCECSHTQIVHLHPTTSVKVDS